MSLITRYPFIPLRSLKNSLFAAQNTRAGEQIQANSKSSFLNSKQIQNTNNQMTITQKNYTILNVGFENEYLVLRPATRLRRAPFGLSSWSKADRRARRHVSRPNCSRRSPQGRRRQSRFRSYCSFKLFVTI